MQRLVIGSERTLLDGLDLLRGLDLSKAHVMEVKEYRANRSNNQNNLFQKWIRLISEHTGDTHKSTYRFFEDEFLEKEVVTIGGVSHEISGEAKNLNTKEFSEFMERVMMWTAEHIPGMRLPLPDDGYYEALMRDG